MPGLQSTPTRAVTGISTARRDVWSLSTAPLSAISPLLNFPHESSRCRSRSRSRCPSGDTGNVSATFISEWHAKVERHAKVNFVNLSRIWQIGRYITKRTLEVTTQLGVRTALHPLHRRYHINHLHLHRRRLNGDWFTDTLFSKVMSVQGNMCAQVFTNGSFTTVHPLDSKAKVAQALTEFVDNVGIPNSLLSDGAPEMVGQRTEIMKEAN